MPSFHYSLSLPGDKSISHRGILLAALLNGTSRLREIPDSGDISRTISSLRALGVGVRWEGGELLITPDKGDRLREPAKTINCGNSGTTMRLLAGLLAPSGFLSVLTGDSSLLKRPMDRVIAPLKQMGARIYGRNNNRYAPLVLLGSRLREIRYQMLVPSAQVKSAILLAGLRGGIEVTIVEEVRSRDHLEVLLEAVEADIEVRGKRILLRPTSSLRPLDMAIPGDISSASFFIVLALMVPDARIHVRDVLLNPTRTGFIDTLNRMGADIIVENRRVRDGEWVGDVVASTSELRSTRIGEEDTPSVNDEVPVLAIAAARAYGVTDFERIGELRLKESDRIASIVRNLRGLGVDVEEREDGFSIRGTQRTLTGTVNAYGDHRIAMAFSVLGATPHVDLKIRGAQCVGTSFPSFFERLEEIAGGYKGSES